MLNKKKINKFYVGASHIAKDIFGGGNGGWTRATLKEAIEHGKEVMESEDRDCVIIVQIVRIIKRKDQPIVVERI